MRLLILNLSARHRFRLKKFVLGISIEDFYNQEKGMFFKNTLKTRESPPPIQLFKHYGNSETGETLAEGTTAQLK